MAAMLAAGMYVQSRGGASADLNDIQLGDAEPLVQGPEQCSQEKCFHLHHKRHQECASELQTGLQSIVSTAPRFTGRVLQHEA